MPVITPDVRGGNAMTPRTIGIMQPTYMPWLGYFALLDRVDRFVFLDSVQFAKRSWQQRNRIKMHNKVQWLTVPVLTKGRSRQEIRDVEIDQTARFADKHVRTLEHAYRQAPFFDEYMSGLAAILRRQHTRLSELNIAIIAWINTQLGISTSVVRSSELDVSGRKAELLADICDALDADCYYSAEGSRDYIEESSAFTDKGIKVRYQAYEHPRYPQLHGDFVGYLSVVDLLFNVGSSSLSVVRRGCS